MLSPAVAGRHSGGGSDAETVREIALGLPGAAEKVSWGMVTFRLSKGLFASLSEDETTMGFRLPREERAEMIAAEPGKFFVRSGHDDRYDWLRVRLDAVGDEELREIISGGSRPPMRSAGRIRPCGNPPDFMTLGNHFDTFRQMPRRKNGRTGRGGGICSANISSGVRVGRNDRDIGSIDGLAPGPTGEMITMARQQLVKRPKPPRQPSPLDLRTPSGRLLPY
ncbi:MmcQ/YjbR family DNA-binding protein [Spirillospora sp. CA-255316]